MPNYLGYELSETYDGRLVIVMPNGVGVYWHANPAGATKLAPQLSQLKPGGASPSALVATTVAAVDKLEAAAGVDASKLSHPVSANASPGRNQAANSNATAPPATKPVTRSPHTHGLVPGGADPARAAVRGLAFRRAPQAPGRRRRREVAW